MNKKGYMLVEIIVASALAFTLAYFIMTLTINLKNKNDDMMVRTTANTDKIIINNTLMSALYDDSNDFDCSQLKVNPSTNTFSYGSYTNIISDYINIGATQCSKSPDNNSIFIYIPLTVPQLPGEDYSVKINYFKENKMQQVTINGAYNETISYYDANDTDLVSPIGTFKTSDGSSDDNGTSIENVDIQQGTYIFKGTVGKYKKTITVTKDTQEINVYPDGAIYWYGNGDASSESLYSVTGGFISANKYSKNCGNIAYWYNGVLATNTATDKLIAYHSKGQGLGGVYVKSYYTSNTIAKGSYTGVKVYYDYTYPTTYENLPTNYSAFKAVTTAQLNSNPFKNVGTSAVLKADKWGAAGSVTWNENNIETTSFTISDSFHFMMYSHAFNAGAESGYTCLALFAAWRY